MKRFQFSLEGVSRVRGHEVKSRQAELARASRAFQAAEASQEETAGRLRLSLRQRPGGDLVDVSELMDQEHDRARYRRELVQGEERLSAWALRVEEERARLLDARLKVKAVEKLRERRYVEFVHQVLRQEQKVTDEVAARVRWREAA